MILHKAVLVDSRSDAVFGLSRLSMVSTSSTVRDSVWCTTLSIARVYGREVSLGLIVLS